MSYFRPVKLKRHASSYGCGCGCNSCGEKSQVAYGSLAYAGLEYGAVHKAVRVVPEYGAGWFFGKTFEKYNPIDKWYRRCAEYRAACDEFTDFYNKVVGVYGTRLKDQSCGGKSSCKSDPYLKTAVTADNRLVELQAKARQVLDKCQIADKAAKEGDSNTVDTNYLNTGGSLTSQQTVSNTGGGGQEEGGSLLPIIIGGGALALMVVGAVVIKKRRKAAKLAAEAGAK